MRKLKRQVKRGELDHPLCARKILKKRVGGDSKAKKLVALLTKHLDKLRVRFAVVGHRFSIRIFIEARSFQDC